MVNLQILDMDLDPVFDEDALARAGAKLLPVAHDKLKEFDSKLFLKGERFLTTHF